MPNAVPLIMAEAGVAGRIDGGVISGRLNADSVRACSLDGLGIVDDVGAADDLDASPQARNGAGIRGHIDRGGVDADAVRARSRDLAGIVDGDTVGRANAASQARNDSASLVVYGEATSSDAGSVRAGDGAEVVERSSVTRFEPENRSGHRRVRNCAGPDIVGVVVVVEGAIADPAALLIVGIARAVDDGR
jgi:hypothetical protein